MEKKELRRQINLSAPNLINICVDEKQNGELSGRLYHCYNREAVVFSNVVELVRNIEDFFDSISFPQASTKSRSFIETPGSVVQNSNMEKVRNQEDIIQHVGNLGTFVTYVKFRQNSTWQGEMYWMEKEMKNNFTNVLDFIKLIDNMINSAC